MAIAPLRERPMDIAPLFRTFIEEFAAHAGNTAPEPSTELIDALQSYRWPGNGLELSNFAAIFAVSGSSFELAAELRRRSRAVRPAAAITPLPLKEQVRKASRELE